MMITASNLFAALIIAWVAFYTLSYGLWTLRKKNKLGGIAVLALVAFLLFLSVYSAIKKG